MDLTCRSQMRDFVTQRFRMHGDLAPLNDEERLFSSGRLDSLDAVEIIMFLETEYGLSFSAIHFDLTELDTVIAISDLIDRHAARA